MGPAHPCGFLLGMPREQGPESSLPRLFPTVVFVASNLEGGGDMSPYPRQRTGMPTACYKIGESLILVFLFDTAIHEVYRASWRILCKGSGDMGS